MLAPLKSGVKKCLEICASKGGGVGRLMANTILKFHFDYWHTSLSPSTEPGLLISRLSNEMLDDFISFDSNDCYNVRLTLKINGVDHFTLLYIYEPVMWCGDEN